MACSHFGAAAMSLALLEGFPKSQRYGTATVSVTLPFSAARPRGSQERAGTPRVPACHSIDSRSVSFYRFEYRNYISLFETTEIARNRGGGRFGRSAEGAGGWHEHARSRLA